MPAKISVEKTLRQAALAAKKQDWLNAVHLNKMLLERFPGNKKAAKAIADIRSNAVQSLFVAGTQAAGNEDWETARESLEAAHYLAPEERAISLSLGNCYLQSDVPVAALALGEELLSFDASDAEAHRIKGHALHELNQAEAAKQALQKALALAPTDGQTHRLLGMVEQSQGQLDRAEMQFKLGLDAVPGDVSLLRHLSIVKREVHSDDPDLAMMRQTLAKLGPQNPRAALLHFALFDMLHKAGESDMAFRHLKQGNDLLADQHPYDFKSEAIVGALSKNLLSEPLEPLSGPVEPRFIFVTGMPRTGTTLTERILAQDPRVQACGELSIVRHAVFEQLNEIQQQGQIKLTSKRIETMRARILEAFDKISDGRPIAVDKMPLNFRWIGYICAALPEARIVHMSRDPRAVAWSLYRQVFRGRGHDFIFTPDDIARFVLFHDDLMDHWRKICGDRIYDLDYSSLIHDPMSATQNLAEALGLEWNEDWLSPEKANNHVRTASVVQVTKPIYAGSDDAWKTYEAQLTPMMASLTSAKLI